MQDPELFELIAQVTSKSLWELSPHSLSDLIWAYATARDPLAPKVCMTHPSGQGRLCNSLTCPNVVIDHAKALSGARHTLVHWGDKPEAPVETTRTGAFGLSWVVLLFLVCCFGRSCWPRAAWQAMYRAGCPYRAAL